MPIFILVRDLINELLSHYNGKAEENYVTVALEWVSQWMWVSFMIKFQWFQSVMYFIM